MNNLASTGNDQLDAIADAVSLQYHVNRKQCHRTELLMTSACLLGVTHKISAALGLDDATRKLFENRCQYHRCTNCGSMGPLRGTNYCHDCDLRK